MTILSWIIGLPLAIAAVIFAISNRHGVRLELWPLPYTVDLPVYLVALAPLAVGVLLGGFIGWASAGKARRDARASRKRARELEQQVEVLRQPANDAQGRPLLVSKQ